ncbi:MAG: hypothetical protein ACJ8FP_05155, partial [Xanthobacteraceae bacterium]
VRVPQNVNVDVAQSDIDETAGRNRLSARARGSMGIGEGILPDIAGAAAIQGASWRLQPQIALKAFDWFACAARARTSTR